MARKKTSKKTTKTKKKASKSTSKKKTSAKKPTSKSSSKKKKTTKKSAKKTTKKKTTKAAKKKPTTKASKSTKKKKTTKKSTKKTAKAAGKKKTTKKTSKKAAAKTKKKSAKAGTSTPSPSDNGKSRPKPPPVIHRVVRPTPPPSAEPTYEDWTPLSDAKLRRIKSGLSRKELNEFKQLLLEKRAEIVGDVIGMEEARSGGNGGDLSNMPLHMADIGSDNYEQEFTLGLVESERKLLVEIDRALQRIKDKTYGVCIVTGTPIPKARLEIKPWAKYSIEVVREREKRGLHSF